MNYFIGCKSVPDLQKMPCFHSWDSLMVDDSPALGEKGVAPRAFLSASSSEGLGDPSGPRVSWVCQSALFTAGRAGTFP